MNYKELVMEMLEKADEKIIRLVYEILKNVMR